MERGRGAGNMKINGRKGGEYVTYAWLFSWVVEPPQTEAVCPIVQLQRDAVASPEAHGGPGHLM